MTPTIVLIAVMAGLVMILCLAHAGGDPRPEPAVPMTVPASWSRTAVATRPRPVQRQQTATPKPRPAAPKPRPPKLAPGRTAIDLHPPMPTPVHEEDLPQVRTARRRIASREVETHKTTIMQLQGELDRIQRQPLTDEELETLLRTHYREVLRSKAGRAVWLDLLAAAEQDAAE